MFEKQISSNDISRRQEILGGIALATSAAAIPAALAEGEKHDEPAITKNRINQTVCQWCYSKMPVEDLAKNAAAMGLKGMDLVKPEHWPTLPMLRSRPRPELGRQREVLRGRDDPCHRRRRAPPPSLQELHRIPRPPQLGLSREQA